VKEPDGVIDGIRTPAPRFVSSAQIALVRMQVADGTLGETLLFVVSEPDLECRHDEPSETFLDREHLLERPILALGPQVLVADRVDELGTDSQLVSRAPHASLQDAPNAKLTGDGLELLLRIAEGHRRQA
jgi:hypothetical protein